MPRPSRILLSALVSLVAWHTDGAAQQRVRELPAPGGLVASGDTAHTGTVVTGVDHNARYLNFTLKVSSRIEVYAMDRSGQMHQMVSCYLDSGVTTVQPTLTEVIDNSAAYQAGSSFGNSSAGRPAARQTSQWRYAASQERLLIMIMEETPLAIRGCDRSGTGTIATFGIMHQDEALDYLPRSLLRYPQTKWAAFLVQP